jgi:NAD(P)-dependent dehydrogenase (short-subunit alcohol dehydrogenase family)
MRIDLEGKTALVSGSTAGIGFAIAKGLAGAGAKVIVNGRTEPRIEAAIAKIKEAHPDAVLDGAAGDVSTAAGCAAVAGKCPDVDILVNNAGVGAFKDFFEIADEEWEHLFQTNVMSGVRLSRLYMKGMLARNWGRIVFISSESGLHIPADMIHYGFSKAAQLAVSRGLAELTAGTGVTVNAVLPGPTRSEGVEGFLQAQAKRDGITVDEAGARLVKAMRPTSLLQRIATTDEVANMVVYACSKEASATNGAALRVEGGIVRTIA